MTEAEKPPITEFALLGLLPCFGAHPITLRKSPWWTYRP